MHLGMGIKTNASFWPVRGIHAQQCFQYDDICLGKKQGMLVDDYYNLWYNRIDNFWCQYGRE